MLSLFQKGWVETARSFVQFCWMKLQQVLSKGGVIGVSSASTSAGANIVQWSNTGGFDQQWSLVQV